MNSKNNGFTVSIPDDVTNDIICNYIESMKDSLLKGKPFYIKGIGKLEPKFRKVKNNQGRDYTITIRLKQESGFVSAILSSYAEDNTRFQKTS